MRNGYVTKANGTRAPAYDNRTLPVCKATYQAQRASGKLLSNEIEEGTVVAIIGGINVHIDVADIVSWKQFSANAFDGVLSNGGGQFRSFDPTFFRKVTT